MRSFKLCALLVFVGLIVIGRVDLAQAKTAVKIKSVDKPSTYLRIFYYQNDYSAAYTSLRAHYRSIDVVAPQSYAIDERGTLSGRIDPKVLAFSRRNKIKVMPLVTNDDFNSSVTASFLDDPVAQAKAINMLVAEALKNKFWGWQIDFEQMDIAYRDKFSNFVKNGQTAFKENKLILSVAVVAQISNDPADYITAKHDDLWQKLIGVYDYAALASSADFISLMSYDDPGSSGPPARIGWVKLALAYALKFIPPQKLSLGIPLYYWQWNAATAKHVGTGGYAGIKNVLNKYHVVRGYDANAQAPFIKYKSKKINYVIWYENARSLKQDLALISEYHLHGFSAWALGQESPDIYNAIRK